MEEKVMKDCKVLALCSQKGGVGKTTSCVNLAVGLAKAGKKVLVIDNRSEERRVGKECRIGCRSRWSPYH